MPEYTVVVGENVTDPARFCASERQYPGDVDSAASAHAALHVYNDENCTDQYAKQFASTFDEP